MWIPFLLTGTVLLLLAWRAGRAARDTEDFFLAGRTVQAGLLALSQVSNALPPWLLVSVAGAAFVWGFAAVWLLLTTLIGYAFGWYFVAPRLHAWSLAQDRVTLPQLLTGDTGIRNRGRVLLSTATILFMAILIGMTAYLPLLGEGVASLAPVSPRTGMLAGLSLAVLCALVGGYKGACLNDGVRAILLLLSVVTVAVLTLIAAGGWTPVWAKLMEVPEGVGLWTGEQALILSVTFVLGTLMLGLAPFGQPQVVSQFMASADAAQLKVARRTALVWVGVVVTALLISGWAARLLWPGSPALKALFPELVQQVLPAAGAAVGLAVLLVFAFSALDGVLLVMAAAVSVDIKAERARASLDWPKPAVVLAGALVAAVALLAPAASFDRLLLAWTLLGSAFAPLLLVRLTGKRIRPLATLASMWGGFLLTLILHLLPDAPGDFLERALPFVVALGIALTGGERRRDPDRADRSQRPAEPVAAGPTGEDAG